MKLFANLDWFLMLPILIISFFGLLVIFSINSSFLLSQIIFLFIGLGLYFLLANFDYRIFKRFFLVFYVLSLILLLFTFILGQATRGSIRWIRIGQLTFQSSELIKPLLILAFASLALKKNLSKIKNVLILSVLFFIPVFLIFKQPDLGNGLVIFVIGLAIIFAAGIKLFYLVLGFLGLVFLWPLFWKTLKPYQQQRIISFVDPNFDPLGTGYQLLQSVITIGSGGILGRGLGEGTQSQLKFLPETHSDFIFASFAEELGFIGSSLLLLAYFILLYRILIYAKKAKDNFGYLICIGVFFMIFFQAAVNIAMNLGLLPITGITLPLFSAGGSSLIATLISLGIVQNVGQFLKKNKVIEIG